MTRTLEQRIAAMEIDRMSRETMAAYCHAIDRNDIDGIRAVFDPLIVFHTRGITVNGIDAATRLFAEIFSKRDSAKHFLANHVATQTPRGDIEIRSYFAYTIVTGVDREWGYGSYEGRLIGAADRLLLRELRVNVESHQKFPGSGGQADPVLSLT